MRNKIMTNGHSRLVALLAGATMLGLVSQNALALTAAGSLIDNTATLQFTVGGVAQNSIDSSPVGNATPNLVTGIPAAGTGLGAPTQFLVDYKVDLTVLGGTVTNVTPGQAAGTNVAATPGAYTTFTVNNLSNATQDFALTATDAALLTVGVAPAPVVTDAFNSGVITLYLDNGDNVLGAGDTVVTSITVAAGATAKVFAASSIPLTAANGQSSLIGLQAQAIWPAALPAWAPIGAVAGAAIAASAGAESNSLVTAEVVFADTAVTGPVVDGLRDGKHSAYDAYTVASAIISVQKTLGVLCDLVNGGYSAAVSPLSIPGSAQQYAITIKNTGTGPANLTTLSDTLPATLTLDASLLGGVAGTAITPATCINAGVAGLGSFGYVVGTTAAPGYTAPGWGGAAPNAAGGTTPLPAGGVTLAPPLITINFGVLLPTTLPGPAAAVRAAAGDLMPGEAITVYFNAFVL